MSLQDLGDHLCADACRTTHDRQRPASGVGLVSAGSLLPGTKLLKLILRDLVNLEVVSRQPGDVAGVGKRRNWALVHGDGFRFPITFSTGFVVVLNSGVRVE
jgi:hypothetical protein